MVILMLYCAIVLTMLPSVGNEKCHQLVSTSPLLAILNGQFSSDEDI